MKSMVIFNEEHPIETQMDRENLVRWMNDYVLDEIGDETVFEYWWTYGVPDSPSDDDYEFITSDEETFMDVVRVFRNCIKMS